MSRGIVNIQKSLRKEIASTGDPKGIGLYFYFTWDSYNKF